MVGMKATMSVDFAKELAGNAAAKAADMGVSVSIAVVDDAGTLKVFYRMDGSSNCSVDIAIAKARHAINYRRATKYHEDVVQGGGLVALAFPDFLPVEGGIPIQYKDEYIGAIGVSGAQSEQDGEIAGYAIERLASELEA